MCIYSLPLPLLTLNLPLFQSIFVKSIFYAPPGARSAVAQPLLPSICSGHGSTALGRE